MQCVHHNAKGASSVKKLYQITSIIFVHFLFALVSAILIISLCGSLEKSVIPLLCVAARSCLHGMWKADELDFVDWFKK